MPKAYIGWCEELQKDAPNFEFARDTIDDGHGAWYVAKNEVVERYRERSIRDLVQRLWDMYFTQKPRTLVRFEDVLRGVIYFRKTWLEARSKSIQ